MTIALDRALIVAFGFIGVGRADALSFLVPSMLALRLSELRFLLLLSIALVCAPSTILAQSVPAPRSWPPDPFTPLTVERIAALPSSERGAWKDYWNAPEKLAAALQSRPQADRSPLQPRDGLAKGGTHTKGLRFDQEESWYSSNEARAIADRVAIAQTAAGAWAKGMDYTAPVDEVRRSAASASGTFDNNATIFELRFLARVISAVTASAESLIWHDAFNRGVKYVFAAQYPNGGYPQVYPLAGGYHDGVTYNDDAMVHIMDFLRDIAYESNGTGFASSEIRGEATARLQLGVECVLRTQLKNAEGQLTVWCQQYDPLTLRPSAARNFEPIADASKESASIALFLMSLRSPSPEIIAAVDGAAAWFRHTALQDLKIASAPADTRGRAVPAPGAPPIWSRFYEPGTSTPIFGDRDRTIHYDLNKVSKERVAGYAWYTQSPAKALSTYGRWKKAL